MKLIQNFKVFDHLVHTLVSVGPDLLGANILKDGFGLPGIVPEVVLMGNAFLVFDLYPFAIVVKDTSLGRRRGPLSLSVVRRSCGCFVSEVKIGKVMGVVVGGW
jgi:hypothetical protein